MIFVAPSGTTFQNLTAPASWNCTTPAVGGTGSITCSTTTLSATASVAFTLKVHLSSSAADGAQLCDTASVSTTTTDPAGSNNSSQVCGTIRTLADLALSQKATTSGSAGKGTAMFSLTLKNNGPSDSSNISVVATSTLFVGPPPLTVTASPGGTCRGIVNRQLHMGVGGRGREPT